MAGRPEGGVLAQAFPTNAAASAAAIASSIPCNGTIPRAKSSSACSSGKFSAIDATIAPRASLAFNAASKARTVGHQSASEQRSVRGKSSTSMFKSNPPETIAVKVAIIAGSSFQMKVW